MILTANSVNNVYKIKPYFREIPSFGFNPYERDKLELSNRVRKVNIQDINGKNTDAIIVETRDSDIGIREKKFTIYAKGKQLGYVTVCDGINKDYLYLMHISTEEHEYRHYKGSGTELLKCAVNESIKRGYNGQIKAKASHGASSPLAFYYKNNFFVSKPYNDDCLRCRFLQNKNASIHYAIINNLSVDSVLEKNDAEAFMSLDENGAQSLLKCEKLYKKRKFEKITQKNINGTNYSANLVQSPYDDEYYLLIANEDDKKNKTSLIVTMKEKEKNHYEICDIDCIYEDNDEVTDFALETIENIARKKGYNKTTVAAQLRRDTERFFNKKEKDRKKAVE